MQTSQIQFWMPVRICRITGEELELKDHIVGGSVVIVTDQFLFESGIAVCAEKKLGSVQVAYFYDVEPNPSTDTVDRCTAFLKECKATTVIGIGGGSCMDTAKAAAVLASGDLSLMEYIRSGRMFPRRNLSLILVPTTAGTGSEVTNVGVYTDSYTGEKFPVVSGEFYADLAVIYPPLTYGLPGAVTANTGMDAFCHAIEAYWNRKSQAVCDALAIEAIRKIMVNLPQVCHNPNDQKARDEMCTASLLAGLAFSQTRTTGIHGLSYPITARYHIPHGLGCALTLPAFIRLCAEETGEKLLFLCRTLGYETVEEFAVGVEALMKHIGLPQSLRAVGAKEEELEELAAEAMNYAGQLALTPADLTREKVLELLRSVY